MIVAFSVLIKYSGGCDLILIACCDSGVTVKERIYLGKIGAFDCYTEKCVLNYGVVNACFAQFLAELCVIGNRIPL